MRTLSEQRIKNLELILKKHVKKTGGIIKLSIRPDLTEDEKQLFIQSLEQDKNR